MRRFRFLILILILVLIGSAAPVLMMWPLTDAHPKVRLASGTLAIREARIYPSPDAAPIERGNVVVRDGLIAEVRAGTAVPAEAQVIACDHCVVMAGFWNTHIHFTESKWMGAAWKPAARLNAQLADMLTSRGFTTVIDLGADPGVTISLRRRIEAGELAGPKIYMSGAPHYPPKGIPYYLKDTLPFYILWQMPQPEMAEEAVRIEENNIARGRMC